MVLLFNHVVNSFKLTVMKISKGSYLQNKYILSFMFPVFVILAGVSCNDHQESDALPEGIVQNGQNKLASTSGVISQSINTGLSSMYLLNFSDTSKNQLRRLLSDENYKKLFFQTYLTKNGKFTLVAFAGKQNGKEFNPNYEVLNLIDDHGTQDLQDKEVFLGDQTLADEGFNMLKDALNTGSRNDRSKDYVVFTPELKRFGQSYVIEYSIRFTSTVEQFDISLLPARSGRLNPSPPY
jgi:hypothetical protein